MNNLSIFLEPLCHFLGKFKLSKKTVALSVLAIFVVSFLPILLMSFYSVASADDYNFAVITHQAWEDTHSFIAVIKAAFDTIVHFYLNWQGFFSANFVPSLNPFIFNENLYFLCTFICVISFNFGAFYMAKQVLKRYFQADGYDIILVVCPVLLLFYQLIPSAAEWLYWFDAGQSMVFYALVFWLMGILFKCSAENKAGFRDTALTVILAIILSGTSGASTFLLVFMAFKIINDMFLNKKSKSVTLLNFLTVILVLFGFVITLIAPGNSMRATEAVGTPFFKAIILSFFYSFTFLESNIVSILALMIALTPIAIILVQKSKFTFRYPLLILAISYCIYASRFFSTLFTMSSIGSLRQRNGYFFYEILLFVVNLFYFWGWVYKKSCKNKRTEWLLTDLSRLIKRYSALFAILVFAVAGLAMLRFGVKETTSLSCTLSIVSGEAKQYKEEMDRRLELYLDDSVTDVEVEPLSSIPYVFKEECVTSDPDYWTNQSLAQYYNKNSVVLIEKPAGE